MKRLIFIIFILLVVTNIAAKDKMRIAVFEPTVSGTDVDSGTKIAIREIISSTIVNTDEYSLVERSMLERVMQEQEFSNSGIVDDSQATEIGKLAGANKVIVSILTKTGGRNMLSIKLIDVKTAAVEKQQLRLVSPSELLNIIEPMTLELIDSAYNPDDMSMSVMDMPEHQVNGVVNNEVANARNDTRILSKKKSSYLANPYDKRGYRGFVEFGGGGLDGGIISLTTSHGYQFNPYFYLGAAISFDTYVLYSFSMPLSMDSRVYFCNKNITPYFGFRVGYSPVGGAGYNVTASFGASFMISKTIGLNAALSYGVQDSEDATIGCMAFKIGLEF